MDTKQTSIFGDGKLLEDPDGTISDLGMRDADETL